MHIHARPLRAGTLALAIALGAAACSDTKDLVNPPPPVDPLFTSYVSLGNSITAGFESGGINDSTQRLAYPVLVAQQMGTPFVIPSLRDPGCPPPIANFLTGERVGGPSAPLCSFRSDVEGVPILNNVAVPGSNAFDPTSATGSGGGGPLTTFILGGKTQVQRALDAKPTFVSAWVGNNDVLPAALSGLLSLTKDPAGNVISPGVTALGTFTKNYGAMMSALTGSGTVKGGVLIAVVNVAGAPIFFPAAALFDPAVKGAVDQVVGTSVTVDTSCTPTTPSLVNFQLIAAMRAGTQPDTIACHALAGHLNLLGDLYVLDGPELVALTDTVAAYNAYIAQTASANNWAYVDPNEALLQLKAAGQVPLFPNLLDPTKPFGDYFSLDGVHPAKAAHQLLANLVIDAVNAQYGTSIPDLSP